MSSLLGLSTSAMFANSAALRTIGHNISNANTPGYSRQQVELANETGQYTGAGFFGHGVKVQTVQRAHNEFLTREAALSRSQASADQTRLEQLQRLENLFPPGAAGIGAAATDLFNSFTDVANAPQDLSARQVVLSKAQELASRMRVTSEQVESLQQGVVSDLRANVATVNSLAQQVAKLNDQIASVHATGQPPNDLLDQRDKLISDINQYVQVTTIPDADGTMGLFVGGGQVLVLGSQANQLAVTPDIFDANKGRLSIDIGGVTRELSTASIAGGSMLGLLQFQDNDLTDARNMLGQLAAAMAQQVNTQQSLGLDLNNVSLPVATRSGGGPIFSVGGPRIMTASTNAASDTNVSVTVTDATQVQASDYLLEFDGANFVLTRQGGNAGATTLTLTPAQIAAGYSIDGMTIGPMTGTAPAAGDRFLFQPVGQAGLNMQRVLSDPKGIAAASPVTATLAANNTGTTAVGSLSVSAAPATPYTSFYVYFSSSTASTVADQYAIYDASIPPPPGAAVPLVPTTPISAGTTVSYNGIDLTFTGVPNTDDVINVNPTVFAAGNNGNAKALLNLRDNGMVGRVPNALGALQPGTTAAQAYAEAMSSIGVRVQGAEASANISQSIADNAAEQLSNQTGVNLDEEAARLIQFQQSYQAAAKILQVAQTVFDSLLNAAN